MDDDALFTPMPKVVDKSSNSLFDRPSSRASSCTRIFFVAKNNPSLLRGPGRARTQLLVSHTSSDTLTLMSRSVRSLARSSAENPRRRVRDRSRSPSCSTHEVLKHTHAPRPGPAPSKTPRSVPARIRINSVHGRLVRQATQVRVGVMRFPPRTKFRRPRELPCCRRHFSPRGPRRDVPAPR